MKRVWVAAVLAAVLLLAPVGVMAGDGFGLYVGLGGAVAIQRMDVDQYNDYYVKKYKLFPDFDDTAGFYAVIGGRIPIPDRFRVAEMFCFELEANWVPNFEFEGVSNTKRFPRTRINMDVDVATFTGAVRFDPQIGNIVVWRPYILVGGGLMIGQINTSVSSHGESHEGSDVEHDPCVKAGVGFDYYLTECLSMNVEGTYVTGWHDLDEIRYTNMSAGLAYHF